MTARTPTNTARLTSPDDSLAKAAGDVLQQAFADGYISEMISGGKPNREIQRRVFQNTVWVGVQDGEVWVAGAGGEGESEDVSQPEATIVVLPPGAVEFQTPHSSSDEFKKIMASQNPESQERGKAFMRTLMQCEEEAQAVDPIYDVKESYYVSHLGTVPSAHGKGLGSRLIREADARAKAAGSYLTLITQSIENVGFYTRLGFRTVYNGEYELYGYNCTLWAMTTAPAKE